MEVVTDVSSTTPLVWSDACGTAAESPRVAKGMAFFLQHRGDEWRLLDGDKPAFGTDICVGINPTLEVLLQRREGDEWFISCRSKRVVRATETTESYLKRKAGGRIEVKTTITRRRRKGRNRCESLIERQTVLRPRPPQTALEPLASPPPSRRLSTPAADALPQKDLTSSILESSEVMNVDAVAEAVQPPFSVKERQQLEADFSLAVKREASRTDVTPLKIIHDNQMSADFKVVTRRYQLDGKPVSPAERSDWGALKSKSIDVIFDDISPVGVHVLEVEFVYLAEENVKLRLKDAVFFDVDEGKPLRVKILATETGNFFTPLSQRPKLKFTIDGKPYQR